MKKTIAFILAVLIALNSFVFNLIFVILIEDVKADNNDKIRSAQYEEQSGSIVILIEGIDKIVKLNSHEILFDKELYDIIYTEKNNGKITYHCLKDVKETIYVNALSYPGSMQGKSALPVSAQKIMIKKLYKNYLSGFPGLSVDTPGLICLNLFIVSGILFIPQKKFSPPPEIIIV